jgi:hypothetical protein
MNSSPLNGAPTALELSIALAMSQQCAMAFAMAFFYWSATFTITGW